MKDIAHFSSGGVFLFPGKAGWRRLAVLCGVCGLLTVAPRSYSQARATGGTITTNGLYTVHTFYSSGTFTVTSPISSIDVVIVAGGGGGGHQHAGGAGAGGVLTPTGLSVSLQAYDIHVGQGGPGCITYPYTGTNGEYSSAFGYTAVGGGAGTGMDQYGNSGGSGGANGYPSGGVLGGDGTAGQGNNGNRVQTGSAFYGGGGGGAGGVGYGVNGGPPLTTWAGTFGGGGGGGFAGGAGGGAGAGAGGYGASYGGNAAANTGSGGGGGGNMDAFGGNGGSGIVVIRYLTGTPAPVVQSVTADQTALFAGESTTIHVRATDGDSNLRYINLDRISPTPTGYFGPGSSFSADSPPNNGAYDLGSGQSDYTRNLTMSFPTAGVIRFRGAANDGSGWYYNDPSADLYITAWHNPTVTLQILDATHNVIALDGSGRAPVLVGRQYYIRISGVDADGNLGRLYSRINRPDGTAYDYPDLAVSGASASHDFGPYTAAETGIWVVWGHAQDANSPGWGAVSPWDGNSHGWASAWGPNILVYTPPPDTDTDQDGVPDSVETLLGTNPSTANSPDTGNQTTQLKTHRPTQSP